MDNKITFILKKEKVVHDLPLPFGEIAPINFTRQRQRSDLPIPRMKIPALANNDLYPCKMRNTWLNAISIRVKRRLRSRISQQMTIAVYFLNNVPNRWFHRVIKVPNSAVSKFEPRKSKRRNSLVDKQKVTRSKRQSWRRWHQINAEELHAIADVNVEDDRGSLLIYNANIIHTSAMARRT